jgi:hypothetical protein
MLSSVGRKSPIYSSCLNTTAGRPEIARIRYLGVMAGLKLELQLFFTKEMILDHGSRHVEMAESERKERSESPLCR